MCFSFTKDENVHRFATRGELLERKRKREGKREREKERKRERENKDNKKRTQIDDLVYHHTKVNAL